MIYRRNQALFVDKEDDDGIFPIYVPGRDHDSVHETFNQFYDWIVSYDLISQWIDIEGSFKYDYRWLSTTHGPDKMKGWAAEDFAHSFGVHPDELRSSDWESRNATKHAGGLEGAAANHGARLAERTSVCPELQTPPPYPPQPCPSSRGQASCVSSCARWLDAAAQANLPRRHRAGDAVGQGIWVTCPIRDRVHRTIHSCVVI